MTTALVCIALLGLLLFGLGLGVSWTRGRTQQVIGAPDDPTSALLKAVRAHGNTTEFAPMLAILILLVGMRDPAAWVVWTMAIATLSRYLIAIGILASPTLERPHPLRALGALGTYVTGVMLCVALLMSL
ncbi:MAG: MAPEG family protein [Myxococcota bacterium]|nr:MAPEG family protein [Myxococcota bacterium]